MGTAGLFERLAARYDAWYDGPAGRAVFSSEVACLRPLLRGLPRPWAEVGAGSGRFAAALGVDMGLDTAAAPLALACSRGVRVVRGVGEHLPFRAGVLGAVLVVVTVCFAEDPAALLAEARWVIRPDGAVVLGEVFAESPWAASTSTREPAATRSTRRPGSSPATMPSPCWREPGWTCKPRGQLCTSRLPAYRNRNWLATAKPLPQASFAGALPRCRATKANDYLSGQQAVPGSAFVTPWRTGGAAVSAVATWHPACRGHQRPGGEPRLGAGSRMATGGALASGGPGQVSGRASAAGDCDGHHAHQP
jgi:SAM-dependent methyltransferase